MCLTETTKACAQWILAMIAFLLVITNVPIISLWLPNLLMGASRAGAWSADFGRLRPPAAIRRVARLLEVRAPHARPYRKSLACLLGCDPAGKSFRRAKTHRNDIACAP